MVCLGSGVGDFPLEIKDRVIKTPCWFLPSSAKLAGFNLSVLPTAATATATTARNSSQMTNLEYIEDGMDQYLTNLI